MVNSNINVAERLHPAIHNITNRAIISNVAHFQHIIKGYIPIGRSDRCSTSNFVKAFGRYFLPTPPTSVESSVVHVEDRI